MRHYLKLLALPLLFLVVTSTLTLAWKIFDLPETEALTRVVGEWFDKYGLPALFFSSILEGLLLVGGYFPGVFVIFLGVLVADSPYEAVQAVGVSTLGLLVAHVTNYFLGKYGWYKLLVKFGMAGAIETKKSQLEKRGPLAIPLSYGFPSIGALTNTAAGIIGMQFRKFLLYSVLSSIFWYSTVGLLVYHIGDSALEIASGGGNARWVVFLIIGIWMVSLVYLDRIKKAETHE